MESHLHILIPTDFSPESELAIKLAKQLSEKVDCQFSLLYVMPVNSVSLHGAEGVFMDTAAIQPSYLQELREQGLEQLKKQAEEHDLDLKHEEVLVDKVSSGIIEYAEEIDSDLIIMGTKQAKGLMAWLSGSDAQVVARLSSVPLLTVMEGTDLLDIKKVLYIHNCEKHPLVAPHRLVMELQKAYDAQLHLLYADPEKDSNKEDVMDTVEDYIVTHNLKNITPHIAEGKDVKKTVEKFQDEDFDMICLGTHGRGQISQLFKKSIAEYIIGNANIPVLTYRM